MAKNSKVTYDEMAHLLHRTRETIRVHIRQLQIQGIIRRDGSARYGKWKINLGNDIHVDPAIQNELCRPFGAYMLSDSLLRRVLPYANLCRPFGACV